MPYNISKIDLPRAADSAGKALAGVWSMINSFGSNFSGLSEGDMGRDSFTEGFATRLTTVLEVELTRKLSQFEMPGYSISVMSERVNCIWSLLSYIVSKTQKHIIRSRSNKIPIWLFEE